MISLLLLDRGTLDCLVFSWCYFDAYGIFVVLVDAVCMYLVAFGGATTWGRSFYWW